MNDKSKKEVQKIIKDIWYNLCILERDYGIEWEGHMIQIVKFTMECIANKYKIDLGLRK